MNELRGSFAANRDDVAAKVMDGELIIIRLSDGTYYSMDNVGTRVWELIAKQHDLPAIVQVIASLYSAPMERVKTDVATLVQQLLDERLIVAKAEGSASQAPNEEAAADRNGYETPVLHIYRDMGNLLALDPPTPGIDDLMFKDGSAR